MNFNYINMLFVGILEAGYLEDRLEYDSYLFETSYLLNYNEAKYLMALIQYFADPPTLYA
jgi:hypothetical protein